MKVENKSLYHIHRSEYMNDLWHAGNEFIIDKSYDTFFYLRLLEEEKRLIDRYNDYDIDYIIAIMEEMKSKDVVSEDIIYDFDKMLNSYYFLRREKALEEGRKLFNPAAPSRLHSLFLCDKRDIDYWSKMIGGDLFKIFLLNLDGNLFVSSDLFFPDNKLMYDIQVEESKLYWKPNMDFDNLRKEYLFQGKVKIIK